MSSSEKNKTLFFFTASFPYGNKAETFIETEILYLAAGFKKIVIFPSSAESGFIRPVPENVEINNSFINLSLSRKKKTRIIIKWVLSFCTVILSEIKDKGLKNIIRHIKIYSDIFSYQAAKASILCNVLQTSSSDEIVFYDYWFENSTLTLSLLKNKKIINKFVSRGHGFDIYDERWANMGVPFRQFKMRNINALYLISKFGKEYFQRKTDSNLINKLKIKYLGVNQFAVDFLNKSPGLPLIISVSGVTSRKKTTFIPELLMKTGRQIHWIHFGDGDEMKILKEKCKNLPESIKYELKGHVNNNEIIDFYKTQHVDLFLSLSDSEGLPVSMMEAISFGVPIVAYPVNGIPEILVEGLTGFNFKSCDFTDYNAEVLCRALEYPFDRQAIIDFFRQNFDAANNYRKFVDEISA